MKLKPTRILAALLASGLLAAALPASGLASAYGIEYFSTVSIDGVSVPGGQLAHLIEGSGLYISTDGANFASVGNLCDSSMQFTYGNGSLVYDGNVHGGCSHVGQWSYAFDRNVPRGSACAVLYEHDWRIRVAAQCHYVY